MIKKIVLLMSIILCCFCLTGCNEQFKEGKIEGYSYAESKEVTNYVKLVTNQDKVILIELYPDVAPITVAHFQDLVKDKFYDNLLFHRVIDGFVIQTGSPDGTVFTSGGESIKGEFTNNGFENNLKHDEGVLSMARNSQDMDSASSQFFICVNTNDKLDYLDGDYATFGKVIAGYDTVLEISKVPTDSNDKPLTPQSIKTARFVTVTKN